MLRVEQVNIYPIKGMQAATQYGGREIEGLHATDLGLFHAHGVQDRSLFVAAESADGELTFVSSRGWDTAQGPKMAHPNDSRLAGVEVDISDAAELRLRAKGVGSLTLSMYDSMTAEATEQVSMHGGSLHGHRMGEDAADFVSEVIGRPARIMMTDFVRPSLASGGRHKKALAADGHGYLVTSRTTLDELNRMNEGAPDVPMNRYRPNIVVDSFGEPFSEYYVKDFDIVRAGFSVAGASSRCAGTNVDIQGERVGGGLRVLRPQRGVELDQSGLPIPGTENVYFGLNANSTLKERELGRLVMVGDIVTVTARQSHPHFQST
jgi:uncharacterized protein YcbX